MEPVRRSLLTRQALPVAQWRRIRLGAIAHIFSAQSAATDVVSAIFCVMMKEDGHDRVFQNRHPPRPNAAACSKRCHAFGGDAWWGCCCPEQSAAVWWEDVRPAAGSPGGLRQQAGEGQLFYNPSWSQYPSGRQVYCHARQESCMSSRWSSAASEQLIDGGFCNPCLANLRFAGQGIVKGRVERDLVLRFLRIGRLPVEKLFWQECLSFSRHFNPRCIFPDGQLFRLAQAPPARKRPQCYGRC